MSLIGFLSELSSFIKEWWSLICFLTRPETANPQACEIEALLSQIAALELQVQESASVAEKKTGQLERLREHLIEMEDTHTADAVAREQVWAA